MGIFLGNASLESRTSSSSRCSNRLRCGPASSAAAKQGGRVRRRRPRAATLTNRFIQLSATVQGIESADFVSLGGQGDLARAVNS